MFELSYKTFLREIILKSNRTVGEIMIPLNYSVSWDDHIIKIIYELNHHQKTIIPVIKDDEVIDILRTIEIMDVIAEILNINKF